MRATAAALILLAFCTAHSGAQVSPRVAALVAAVGPALPFPAADPSGALPADGSAQSSWFVRWPTEPDDARIIVKANPLHPDTQARGASAEGPIQRAIVEAERKAQAAYDRALDELKRTGKATDLDGISLEDEGIAGERIDAELELTIDVESLPRSFDVATTSAPSITAGTNGVTWVVSVPPTTYRETRGNDQREHFTPAESRLYFGALAQPTARRVGETPHFAVTVRPEPSSFVVILRGNQDLLTRVLSAADWASLTRR